MNLCPSQNAFRSLHFGQRKLIVVVKVTVITYRTNYLLEQIKNCFQQNKKNLKTQGCCIIVQALGLLYKHYCTRTI